MRQTWVNNNYAMEGIVHERDGESHVDYWGIRWVKEGPFNQIARLPAGRRVAARRCSPTASRVEHLDDAAGADGAGRWRSAADYFVGCDVSPCVFEMYWRLRGMEDAMLDMAGDPRADPARCSAAAPTSPSHLAGRGLRPLSRWTGCGPATTWPRSSA